MSIPETMCAVQLTGYGGFEKLDYRTDVPVPIPAPGWILVRVSAAGVNNTDINTRVGWYRPEVSNATDENTAAGISVLTGGMGDWTGDIQFPRSRC